MTHYQALCKMNRGCSVGVDSKVHKCKSWHSLNRKVFQIIRNQFYLCCRKKIEKINKETSRTRLVILFFFNSLMFIDKFIF
jgi:hypothetical protein